MRLKLSNEQLLVDEAIAAASRSHSPYSEFPVGAALLCKDGARFSGTNIENASYGLTVCAERVAIFSAVAAGHTEIVMLAVTCLKGDPRQPRTLMPCGACRQVMSEFMKPNALVIVNGVGVFELQELLPQPFCLG